MADNQVNVKFTADIANLQNGLNQAQNGIRSFGNVGTSVMGNLAQIAGTVGVVMATSQVVENFKQWETGLIDIGTQLGNLRQNEVPKFAEGIKNLSLSSGSSFQSLSKGMADVVDRGIQLGKEIEAVDKINRLSITTNSQFQSSLNAVDVVMKQFGASAGSFEQVIDKVFETTRQGTLDMGEFTTFIRRTGTVANGVGVQFDELAGILAFLTEKQVPARVAMQALTAVMTDLTNLSQERIALFKQEGVAIDENTIREKGLGYAMSQLSALSTEALQKIMPNIRNREVLTLITKNYNEVLAKTNEITKSAGVVDAEYAKRQESLSQLTKQLSASFMVLGIEALTPLVPIIKSFVAQVTEVVKNVRVWAEENPKLFETIVKIIAILGTFLTLASSAILILGALAGAFSALGLSVAGMGLKIVSAIETMQLMVMYASGPMLLAIGILITEIALIVKALWEWWRASEGVKESQKTLANSVADNAGRMSKSLEELKVKYSDLTEEELANIETVKLQALALQEKTAVAMKDKKLTEEEQVALTEETRLLAQNVITVKDAIINRTHQAEAVIAVSDGEEDLIVKMKASEIVEKEKISRIDTIVKKYIELIKQYDIGKISQDEFRTKLSEFVDEGARVTGSIDDIIAKLKQASESDFSISLSIRLEAVESLNDLKERVKRAQEDLVLNQATGEVQKRLQIVITLDRQLRAFASEMEAQELKYKNAIHLMEIEAQEDIKNAKFRAQEKGMIESAYLAYRQGLLKADVEKSGALQTETKKAFNELIKLAKENAKVELEGNKDRLGSNKELNDEYAKRIGLLDEENTKLGGTKTALPELGASTTSSLGTIVKGVLQLSKEPAFGTVPMGQPYTIKSSPVLGAFAEGAEYVPMTGLYQLHRGERVLTKEENIAGKAGGVTIVTLIDPKLVPEIMAQYPNAILNVVNADILRNGLTRRVVKSVNK